MENTSQIVKAYGAYSVRFRRWDGKWAIKRLSSQSHSAELARRIADAIDRLLLPQRTTERTDAIARDLFDKEHYKTCGGCGVIVDPEHDHKITADESTSGKEEWICEGCAVV